MASKTSFKQALKKLDPKARILRCDTAGFCEVEMSSGEIRTLVANDLGQIEDFDWQAFTKYAKTLLGIA